LPYIMIDGDDVGVKVESHVLANDVPGFVRSANMISSTIEEIANRSAQILGVKLISVGGDSVLLEADNEAVDALVGSLVRFQRPGALTFSVGVGASLRESFLALRMAKASGKCRAVNYIEMP
jgi:hypothetical protein